MTTPQDENGQPLYLIDLGGYSGASGLVIIDDPVTAPASELAQKILAWIGRTRKEMETGPETYAVDRLDVLVDDIEALCKEQLRNI
jgi:hypothetical protein